MKKVLIVIIFISNLLLLRYWLQCDHFNDRMILSQYDIVLKVNEAIGNDVGYNSYIARFFHNKAAVEFSELLGKYLHYWDVHFVFLFYSLVNCFGILYFFLSYFNQSKKTGIQCYLLIISVLLPLLLLLNLPIPFPFQLIILAVITQSVALYGIWRFMSLYKSKGVIIIFFLLILSIWYIFVFQKDIFVQFCYNI